MSGRRLLDSLDVPMLLTILALVGVGIYAIASATMEQPDNTGLWRTQVVWVVIAAAGATVVLLVDYRIWAGISVALHAGVLGLLVLVLASVACSTSLRETVRATL